MILLTLSRGKGEETVRLQLPASPAEIGETFAFLDRISLDTTATAILDVSSNVPVLYRCLYDVDVEDSEQFQKLQKLAERTEALSPAKAAIFSGALDAECVWNLEGALTVADRLDEYMLVNNVSSDSELGIYLVNKGITPFPDRFKPYINYARVGAEYREKHGGEYSSGNYVQKKTPELLENERLDGVFRIWMENPCPVRVQSETAQITLPATFEQLESARQLLGVDSLNMAKLTRVEALRPYLGEYLPLQGMDLRLEQLDELAENIRIMDQEDGALLKYLSVLEVEQPATLQEALRFSIELDDYERVPDDPEEYGKQVLERIGADEELISTEVRKKELFAKVRSGQVRVLMGSTFKMGAGMNVQDRLVALHDLDCPWRPGDLEQRSGRIIRQGNRNKEVHIYRYVTESTFDAYLWQTVENKQKFISQIMTSKSPVRSCEDIDEAALSYAEIKALCAGDERIREKMDLDVDVARLRLMKANHQSQQYRLEDNILRHFPAQIEENKGFLSGFEADMKTLEAHPHPKDGFAGMEVKGDFLTDKDNAGAAILEAFKDAKGLEPVPIGSYRGFAMSLTVENFGKDFILTLKGKMSHRVELGKDARGNLVRIDNALAQMPERYKTVQGRLENVQAQLATAKAELGKPFPQEAELKEKSARLAELNAELNIDDRTPMEQAAENVVAKRPSVLDKLKAPCVHGAGEKKKSHEQEAR